MAITKKLDIDHFMEPPMIHLKTAEQKLFYAGLRACSDCEGIVPENIDRLRLSIFATSNPRNEDLISTLSFMLRTGAIYRYRVDGEKFIILPHHFSLEGKIPYFSPTEYPRPPKDFYNKFPHYTRRWKAHMDKLQKSAEGGKHPSPTLSSEERGGRGGVEGARGGVEGARGSGIEKLRGPLERIFKKHNIPYDPVTLKPLNVSHSEKTLNDGGSGEGKGSVKGVIEKKRESPKGEKGKEGEINLERILAVCGDEHSKKFYNLVLRRCPQPMVRKALIETQCVIQEKKLRTTPGRYFTGLIKKLAAKERISLDGSKKR